MNAQALPPAERLRLLRALGVQPLVLRRAAATAPAARAAAALPLPEPPPAAATRTDPLALIVLLPAGAAADARQQALLRAALLCLPPALQRAPCIESAALTGTLPTASAYLVLGGEARAALGRLLPLDAQAKARIEHADAPADILAQPARKRTLWRALKALRGRHARSA